MLKLINSKFEHLHETKDLAAKFEHLHEIKDLALLYLCVDGTSAG
jgi:hypothetical protein